jgi:methanogenic corrinoid protein MtbC1
LLLDNKGEFMSNEDHVGADGYAENAMTAVTKAKKLIGT